MSILDSRNPIRLNPADVAATQILNQTRQTFYIMVKAFNEGSRIFWKNDNATPSQIAEKLGTDAKEIFELHYALGQLIANIKPEEISFGINLIGQFTINDDGTVTVIEPTPEPTPETSAEPGPT